METSVSPPSWQRTLYQTQFDQIPQYDRYVNRDPNWSQDEFLSDTVRGDDYLRQRQYADYPNVPSAHPIARRYHQHEEDQTEFRGQGARGVNQRPEDCDIPDSDSVDGSDFVGRREAGASAPRYSPRYDRHAAYADIDIGDRQNFSRSAEHSHLRNRGTGSSSAVVSNSGYTVDSGYTQSGVGDSEEDYISEEEDVDERFQHEDFPEHSWRKEQDVTDSDNADWKRPDMHMFKASSYKGSVTSERSSRLDPHTYQSYAAGLLYSSGRSEKFLKLQKHFAVLERIGELDKSSIQKESDRQNSKWQELGASQQTFQSEEELRELYTELKEAKKKKEFFHDTDRKDQVMWHLEKDFGLKNREHTLKDQVSTYRNLVEDKLAKSPSASKMDKMKRAVSFGELYDKFHKSETADSGQESLRISSKSHDTDHIVKAIVSPTSQPPPPEETEPHSRVTMKQLASGPSSVSYLQLMESAARKSRQRAIHGTHMDSPCNDYEAYVKEMRRINQEDSDRCRLNFHSSSQRPHSHQTNPEPHESGSKEKARYSEEPLQISRDHRGLRNEKIYQSEESLKASRSPRDSHSVSSEIVIDSFSTPKPGLTVRSEPNNDQPVARPVSPRSSTVQPDTRQGHSSGLEEQPAGDYLDLDSTDTTQSESSQERPAYSEMPDIIQVEKHRNKPLKTSSTDPNLFRSTLPTPAKSDPQKRPHSTYGAYTAGFDRENTTKSYSQQKHNQTLSREVDKTPQHIETPQQTVDLNRTRVSEKGAVFQVRDLRNLADNNEFSMNQLSWMKKPSSSTADRDIIGSRTRVQDVATLQPPATAREFRGAAESGKISVSKADAGKSSGGHISQDPHPWAQTAMSTHGKFSTPFQSSDRMDYEEKKAPVPYRKPESLTFQPMPSQSGPSFSASRRGAESRPRQTENNRYTDTMPEYAQSRYSPNFAERNVQSEFSESNRGMKQTGTVSMETHKKESTYTPAVGASQKLDRESDARDTGRGRRPGDGSDSQSSQSSDKQYGQLRKWTAVADIYRDVEKSWSPTRETPSFQPENNSSISSTDTFIVKDTDGEQDDLESSMSSVSRLRQIFERQQKVSKSKSEPDMSSDSNEEPRRPRSAKSQADLSSANKEEASPRPGIPRTVSGDLRDIRHQHKDRPAYSDRLYSSFEPDTVTEQGHPTDVALRAWVHYTDRPRYDPYLPPEDILKEVSSASTGRKLDVPKPKNYRPSNVSRMTLEYLNQIGSEWQQSGNKGYIPQNSQSQGSLSQQSSMQHVDRRYVSHQYVNEENPFASSYPQTDDLKLKQSQWAEASGYGKEPEQHFDPKSYRNSSQRLQEYPAHSQQHEPVVSRPWTPSGPHKAQTPSTQQSEARLSEAPGRQTLVYDSNTTTQRQPASQPGSTDSKPQTAPIPAQRSKLQPWRTRNRETSSPQSNPASAANLPSQNSLAVNNPPTASSGRWKSRKGDLEDRSSLQQQTTQPIPPEPARMPPLSPRQLPRSLSRGFQHSRSKSSDSERSSGDYGGVYCVSTGSVLYGEADEEPAPPPPPSSQSQSSLPASTATFPRKNATRQPEPRGSTNPGGSDPIRRIPSSSSSATFGPSGQAPTPPARGGRIGGGTLRGGAGTLPLPRTKTFPSRGGGGSSLSAAEQLGVKSPPPPSSSVGLGVSGRSGTSVANPMTPSAVFKHQTTDERRMRTEPINPEKERRRKEEEEAYRKKRLEELYEEERLKKMRKDEADAEARRHHDFYTNAQKSPISPNRFDDASAALSPSTPGSLGTLERKGPQLSIPPERRRGFQIQGKARALFNFTAQNPREMSFRKNDIMYLLRQVDKNWFEGERHGLVGIFPTNYVEVVTSIEAAQAAAMQAEGQGRAKYNFTAQSSVELSLRKGEFVVLLRRVDENWYEGRIGNRQGIFPVSYVEITREPSTPLVTPAPSVITTPMTGTPEMLSPVGYDAAPTPPPQPSPSALAYQRSPYSFPQTQHPAYGPASGSLLTPATNVPRGQMGLNQQEYGGPRSPISNPKSPISPGKQGGSPGRRVSPGPLQGSGPTSRLQVDIQSSGKPFANGPPASSSASRVLDDDLAVTRYRAVYAYRPQNEDELELREGDEVFVMEKCDDGWFVGTSGRSGGFGTFPGNYVQKICK